MGSPVSPTTTLGGKLDLEDDVLSPSPLLSDSYSGYHFIDYCGLPSNPISIYRTGDP
ncbi:hypothetical protein PISMIDRAFT_684629 [Pisolithus microcarpus 441]|uniref:Uncharacterized protein n=1 Tax=Pisolithus microcarpus 441 TaxID=765257 RepID=A0A0C9XZZ5_9AGAM|nr:hypothetical protein PISMIDRAFT_684629 [Pisolithus microcarpus 441]